MKAKMKVNLGQLLQAVDTLDQAASKAPLTRQDHLATLNCVALLRSELPELWKLAKAEPKPAVLPAPAA